MKDADVLRYAEKVLRIDRPNKALTHQFTQAMNAIKKARKLNRQFIRWNRTFWPPFQFWKGLEYKTIHPVYYSQCSYTNSVYFNISLAEAKAHLDPEVFEEVELYYVELVLSTIRKMAGVTWELSRTSSECNYQSVSSKGMRGDYNVCVHSTLGCKIVTRKKYAETWEDSDSIVKIDGKNYRVETEILADCGGEE